MGLVSCLDQLHVRVVCVQETHAPSLGTLPVDQSFRYEVLVPLFYRRFLHLRWRLVAGAICVCSFYAPHVGIALDVRVAFWRNLAATVQHVSQVHSHCPLLLAGDSNIWFPTFELGRVRQTEITLIPIAGNDGFPWFGSSQSTG